MGAGARKRRHYVYIFPAKGRTRPLESSEKRHTLFVENKGDSRTIPAVPEVEGRAGEGEDSGSL
jgi:hypothetical protein